MVRTCYEICLSDSGFSSPSSSPHPPSSGSIKTTSFFPYSQNINALVFSFSAVNFLLFLSISPQLFSISTSIKIVKEQRKKQKQTKILLAQ
ncbi:hypothetical protein PP707_04380 [Acetobacter pasteurianus]|nr:hypothetical protein [Acetobacter pasteurianus]